MLVLFDVDGTLLLSSGQGREAMEEAGREVLGASFTLEGVDFAGRLDPLIWADGVALFGGDGNLRLQPAFRAAYRERLEARLAEPGRAWSLPGVDALLARLHARPDTTLGLLTGNYAETGALKLRAAGLDASRFEVPVWGDDAPSRRELLPVAIRRYEARLGRTIPHHRVVVVGDTVHDIDCAHHNGCVALAVATGPSYEMDELRAHTPELLVEDLRDTEGILAFLDEVAREGKAPPG